MIPPGSRSCARVSAAGELSCQDLTARFRLAQATISHHLKVLSDAGLVSVRKGGAFHYYRVVPGALDALAGALATLAGPAAPPRRAAARRRTP